MINSWTCVHSNPLTWDNDAPSNHSENWAYTQTDCVVTGSSTGNIAFSHDEWLFVVMVFVVILSIPLWRFIFGGWVKQ